MLQIILQAVSLYTVSYLFWHLFRKHVAPSSLKVIPGPDRDSIIYGNLNNLYSPWGIPWHMSMSRQFGRVFKIHGILGDEQLYVSDPLALHHVVVKDQDIYEETGMFIKTNQLLFGNSLLGTLGGVHKRQRRMLNPVFSLAHMRGLLPIFYSSARQLREALVREISDSEGPKEINMRPWVTKTALEFIGRAGFGYSFQVFDADSSNEYRSALKDLMQTLFSLAIFRQLLPLLTRIGTPKFRRAMIDFIPLKRLHKMRDISDTITKTSKQIYEQRKADMMGGIEGKDIMSVLLRANQQVEGPDRLDDDELISQINTFVFAGTDTTSAAISRVLHLLSQHPEARKKLRAEVVSARQKNESEDLSYDRLVGLPYLDAVARETLRLYAPITFLSRTTRKDAVLPLSSPIQSTTGELLTAIPIKNNTNVVIGIAAANRDKQIWGEDADEWKPERWLGKTFAEVTQSEEKLPGVYSGMMTFLGGSRACIGFKFSELELKVVISTLIGSLEFTPSERKEILWRNSSIQNPVTKCNPDGPSSLPLRLALVDVKSNSSS